MLLFKKEGIWTQATGTALTCRRRLWKALQLKSLAPVEGTLGGWDSF